MNQEIHNKVTRRLKKIYHERKKWNGINKLQDETSIKKRELVLIEQQILERFVLSFKNKEL